MKIKQKLATWAFFAVALSSVLGPVLSAYLALHPTSASASPVPPGGGPTIVNQAAIVPDTYDVYTGKTTDRSTYSCYAAIHKPTVVGDDAPMSTPIPTPTPWNLQYIAGGLGFNSVGSLLASVQNKTDSYTPTFNDVEPGIPGVADKGVVYISFDSDNSTDNSTLCRQSMVLFRQARAADSITFYGFWWTGVKSSTGFQALTGTVDLTTGTINFTIPSGFSRTGGFSMKLRDPDGILAAGNTVFPPTGGGGSASAGGNCFETAALVTDLQACINQTRTPAPILLDAATIDYGGDIYKATGWGNEVNQITYNLSVPGEQNRTQNGGTAKFVMSTLGSGPGAPINDINMDDKGSVSDIQDIDEALKLSQSGGKLKMTFYNKDIYGDPLRSVPFDVPAAGLTTFATYYAKDDAISLVFPAAGSNEQPYFGTYTRNPGTRQFVLADSNWGGKCNATLASFDFPTTDPKDTSSVIETGSGLITQTLPSVTAVWNLNVPQGSCLGGSLNVNVAINTTDNVPNSSTTATTGSGPQLDCSVQIFNPLSWILCPLASAFEVVVTGLDDEITNYMDIKGGQGSYDGNACTPGGAQWCYYYKPWSIVRDISLAVAVVIALIAILSQAFGFEVFDAYTLRRVLPKLLIAIVGITLSWPLMMFFINLFDALGLGIRSLIYTPFQSINKVYLGGGGQLLSALFIRGGLSLLGYAGILSFAVTAAVIIGSALLILILRQIVLYLVVIAMPFIILCAILPATNKGWKFGSDTFWGVLLVFPIAEGMIAAGHAFAVVMSVNAGALSQIIALVAYLIGYAGVILAPRIAGGAIANIAGFSAGPVRQITGGLSKFRGNKMREHWGAYSTGFKSTAPGTWLEEHKQAGLAGRIATGSGAIPIIGGDRREASTHNTHMGHMAHAAAEALKNNPDAAQNDNANSIARNATSRDDFIDRYLVAYPRADRAEAVSQVDALERAYGTRMGSDQMQHTATAAALASSPATDSVATRAQWMRDAVNSHVMTPTQAASHVKASGSLMASAGFGELLQAANDDISDPDLLTNAVNGFNPANSHRMRTKQAEEAAGELLQRAQTAYTTHGVNSTQFAKAVADYAGFHDVINGMTPDVRKKFGEINNTAFGGTNLRGHQLHLETAPPTLGPDPLAAARQAYMDQRQVWGAAAAAAAAAGAAGAGGGGGGAGGGGAGGGGGMP